jgi:hypothetical protein
MKKCDTSQPILIHWNRLFWSKPAPGVCDASHHQKLGREFGTIVWCAEPYPAVCGDHKAQI